MLCSLCPQTHSWAQAGLLGLIFHCFNTDSADKSRSPPETQSSCVHRRCQCHQCMNNACLCSGIMLRLGRMKPTNQWLPASMADPLSPAGHPLGLCYKWVQALGAVATLGRNPLWWQWWIFGVSVTTERSWAPVSGLVLTNTIQQAICLGTAAD